MIMIEQMESRSYLSSQVVNGQLIITGTANNDRFVFERAGGVNFILRAFENGVAATPENYTTTLIKSVLINCLGGNDETILGGFRFGTTINGGDGNDTLAAGEGNDQVNGDAGNDIVFGRGANDVLAGGTGADDIGGGSGLSDTVDYSKRINPLTVSLGNEANDGEAGENDTVRTDIEIILGGLANDTLSTTSGRNVRIFGGEGNDTMSGGSGNDFFDGQAGRDSMVGNGGNDFFNGFDAEIDTVNGGSGVDFGDFDSNDVLSNL